MRVREAKVGDVDAMMGVERDSPTAAHWSREQYENLFVTPTTQERSERFALVVDDEQGIGKVPEILAFLIAHREDAEWELENIVVLEEARRRGIAMRLLNDFVTYARNRQGSGILLEVRESNHGARALYRKAGFDEEGLRESYYAGPREDAILCRLKLY